MMHSEQALLLVGLTLAAGILAAAAGALVSRRPATVALLTALTSLLAAVALLLLAAPGLALAQAALGTGLTAMVFGLALQRLDATRTSAEVADDREPRDGGATAAPYRDKRASSSGTGRPHRTSGSAREVDLG